MTTPTVRSSGHPLPVSPVTGANKSIGFEIARQLARQGQTILLRARNPALGKVAAEALTSEGLDVHFIHIDLDDEATQTKAANTTDAPFGRLDVLVNNAAVVDAEDGPASVANGGAVRRIFGTNVFGTSRSRKR